MRRALHGRKIARRHPRARRQVLCRDRRVIHRVPQPQVQSQLPNGPLILSVGAIFGRGVIRAEWHRVDGDLRGHLIPECVRPRLVDHVDVAVAQTAHAEVVQVEADFEIVRAGDVRQRKPFVKSLVSQHLIARASDRPGAVPEIQSDIVDRNVVIPHARHPFLIAVITIHRPAGLNQEPAGYWVGVGDRR